MLGLLIAQGARNRTFYSLDGQIRETIKEIQSALRQLSASDSWTSVKAYLEMDFPNHHSELFPRELLDEEGFQLVNHYPERHIGNWLAMGYDARATERRPIQQLEQAPLMSMSSTKRTLTIGIDYAEKWTCVVYTKQPEARSHGGQPVVEPPRDVL